MQATQEKHPGQSGGQWTTMNAHIIVSTVKVWVSLWSPREKVVPKESPVLGGRRSFKRWGLVRGPYRSLRAWWEVPIDHYVRTLFPDKINNSQQRAREKRAQVTSNYIYFSRWLTQGATLTMAALWCLNLEAQLQTLKLFLHKGGPCLQTSNTMLTNNEKNKAA